MLKLSSFIAKYLLVYYLIRYKGTIHVEGKLTINSSGGQTSVDGDALVTAGQGGSVAQQVSETLSGTSQPPVSSVPVTAPEAGVENFAGSEAGENIAIPYSVESQSGEGGPPSEQTEKKITLVNPAHLIVVDVSYKADTLNVQYSLTRDSMNVFAAKDPYFFYKIIENNEVLWESKGEVYPKKVYTTLNASRKTKIRLFYPKGTYISLDAANSFNLNVNYKEANDYYEYERNEAENFDSFKCKTGYKIRVLQKGPHILWEKDPKGEFSVEVIVFTMPNNKLAIVIYLEGGGRVMCYKDDPENEETPKFRCEVDEDISLVSVSSVKQQVTPRKRTIVTADPVLQLFTQGSAGPNDSTKLQHEKKDNRDIYTFNEGVICTEIRVGKHSLWKSSSDGKFPEKVTYYFNVLNISFNNGEGFIYMKKDGAWEHSYSMSQSQESSKLISQSTLPKVAPSVPSSQVILDSEDSGDLLILDSRDHAKTRDSSELAESQQAYDSQDDGAGETIDLSGAGTSDLGGTSTPPDTSTQISTPGTASTVPDASSSESQDSKTSDDTQQITPTDTSTSPETTPVEGSQQVTTLTSHATLVSSSGTAHEGSTVQEEKDSTTPDPSLSPDSTSGVQDSTGTSQPGSLASTDPDQASSEATPVSSGSPESGLAGTTGPDQGKTGTDQDQHSSEVTKDQQEEQEEQEDQDEQEESSTGQDQESTSTSGDQVDSTAKGGQDQDGSTADQDKLDPSSTLDAGSTSSTGEGGQDQDDDDDLVVASSEGSSPGASGTSRPPIPSRRGVSTTSVSSTPASTAQPRARANAQSSGSSRPSGGISISLDDDDDEVRDVVLHNPDRWTKVSALPYLSYYPLYKFVPRLEISSLDPNDSSKKVVNDTSCYDISHEKGNILYKFKSNTKCVLIKYDDKDLWKHEKSVDEEDSYPQYVAMVSRFIYVVFEGYFKLYQKKSDCFKEVHDSMPILEQVDIKDTNKKELYEYIKDTTTKIYKYTAKDDILFNSVKKSKGISCGSSPIDIWDTQFPEYYATNVIRKESGKKDKYLCVYFINGNYSLFFKRKGAKFWEDETSEIFFPSDFRFHTLNDKETQYEELEASKCEVSLDGFIKRFKFVDGAKCHGIRCRNVKLWSHDKIKFGDDYPKEMSLNLLNNQVTVKFDALDFVYEYTGEDLIWKLNSVDLGEYFMAKLTVVTVDENGDNSSENNTNRFEVNKYKTGLLYKFKECGKFVEVRNGSISMWKHDDKSEHPTMLYHDINNNTSFIRFKDSLGICNGGVYRSVKVGEEAPKVDDLILVTLDENGKRKENKAIVSNENSDAGEAEENDADDPTVKELENCNELENEVTTDKTQGNGIGKKYKGPDFTKETLDQGDKIHRFKFGEKVRCVEVKLRGKVLWSHELNKHGREYPKEIILNLSVSTLTINFDSALNYIFVHDGDKWLLDSENNLFDFYLGKFTLVTADDEDGNNSRENDELEYSIEKQKNLFSLFVSEEAKCIKVLYEEQVVWSYSKENPGCFARSISSSPLSGALAIDTDGSSHMFTMEDGLWIPSDASSALPPSSHPQGFTIITLEDGTNNQVENDFNKYKVYDRGKDCYLYHFPEGVRCYEFKFENRKIWGYHRKYKNNYPESISVDLVSGIVEIEIGLKTLTYPLYPED